MNKELDEDKEITIRINKRLFHLIVGLLVDNNSYHKGDIHILSERKIR